MSFKFILFCLFLYVCLIWVAAFKFFTGSGVQEFGLLWTAVGLLAVLVIAILARLWSWARILHSKAAQRPKPAAKAVAPPIPEDEAAVRKLIEEATATLRKAPAYAGNPAAVDLASFPLYLLIGGEGTGKTSTFVNSGLSPQLLAGDAGSTGPNLPTRLCNLWLAKNALFVEIGGRAFTADRIPHILRAFQTRNVLTGWRRWFTQPARPFRLRGVVAFVDVKEFTGASTPQARERLDRQSREWQTRIGTLAESVRASFPLYFLITKCDILPYFGDFFRRLLDTEAEQVLGCAVNSVPADNSDQSVAAESKRLAKSFGALYHSLAERRIQFLSHEPDPEKRPNIYEFPRELKRIRPAVVQFLVTISRPHPLRPNPILAGFYFSGTGEKQVMPTVAGSTAEWADHSAAMEASVLFRGDATQMLGRNEVSVISKAPAAGVTRRWLFVNELFGDLLLQNREAPVLLAPQRATKQNEWMLCAAVSMVCLLLSFAFASSWIRNLDLLNDVKRHAELHRRGDTPTLADLQGLEELRNQLAQLSTYERRRPPLSMRWGLYSGNRVVEPARELYFRRFRELLLNPVNGIISTHLQGLPETPPANAPYNPAFKQLQAHLMISGACSAEPAAVSTTLKSAAQEMVSPEFTTDWQVLANRQIDFYTQELNYGNPAKVQLNINARDRARQYLSQIRGVDRIYARILADAERAVTRPQNLRELSPDYTAVLTGPDATNPVFSREGWIYVEKASKTSNSATASDACVLGDQRPSGVLGMGSDTRIEQGVQQLFVADYVDHWRRYINAFAVKGYANAADSARKLDLLSDHKSPLLALMAMVSNQTDFPAPVEEPSLPDRAKTAITKLIPFQSTVQKSPHASAPAESHQSSDQLTKPSDITRYFQPLHVVVPPNSETWVTEKNGAYMEALAQLGHSMQDLARSTTQDQGMIQAVSQNHDKAMDAARQLARGFEPLGTGGLDLTVEKLLEDPIRGTERFIIDPVKIEAGKVNGKLQGLCALASVTLRKYPFHASLTDASLSEVTDLLGPGAGAIWKYQAEVLGEYTVKEGQIWKAKDPAKKPQVTQDMLNFLNRSQAITDAFYPAGATQPHFTYTLRPKLDPVAYKDDVLELEIDGQVYAWTSSLQKQFSWPSLAAGKVVGRIRTSSLSIPFTSRLGPWAMFRIMGDAEPRPLGTKVVEWRYLRGGEGRGEEIRPAPVRLEFVEFPGGADLFNPRFFDGLVCPGRAVQ